MASSMEAEMARFEEEISTRSDMHPGPGENFQRDGPGFNDFNPPPPPPMMPPPMFLPHSLQQHSSNNSQDNDLDDMPEHRDFSHDNRTLPGPPTEFHSNSDAAMQNSNNFSHPPTNDFSSHDGEHYDPKENRQGLPLAPGTAGSFSSEQSSIGPPGAPPMGSGPPIGSESFGPGPMNQGPQQTPPGPPGFGSAGTRPIGPPGQMGPPGHMGPPRPFGPGPTGPSSMGPGPMGPGPMGPGPMGPGPMGPGPMGPGHMGPGPMGPGPMGPGPMGPGPMRPGPMGPGPMGPGPMGPGPMGPGPMGPGPMGPGPMGPRPMGPGPMSLRNTGPNSMGSVGSGSIGPRRPGPQASNEDIGMIGPMPPMPGFFPPPVLDFGDMLPKPQAVYSSAPVLKRRVVEKKDGDKDSEKPKPKELKKEAITTPEQNEKASGDTNVTSKPSTSKTDQKVSESGPPAGPMVPPPAPAPMHSSPFPQQPMLYGLSPLAGNPQMVKAAAAQTAQKRKKIIRTAAGQKWEDPTLQEWDSNDYRIFCGDLGNEVTDDALARVFSKYSSFQKAKVIREKNSKKSKGYGFVSFKDPGDFIRAMREMNGKYVGNRPIKLRKSNWKDRNIEIVRKKVKEKKKLGYKT